MVILIKNLQIWGAGKVIFWGKNRHEHRKKLSEFPGSSCSAPPGKVALLGPSIGVSPPPPPPPPPGIIWTQNLDGSGTHILRLQGGGVCAFFSGLAMGGSRRAIRSINDIE